MRLSKADKDLLKGTVLVVLVSAVIIYGSWISGLAETLAAVSNR